mmetsp:Transcript_27882/g.52093  ORF Transcript_27882/g.52093 Transcript_27882/m.52093 type:complete len:214 (-) Transcript_27882:567-1208(-)
MITHPAPHHQIGPQQGRHPQHGFLHVRLAAQARGISEHMRRLNPGQPAMRGQVARLEHGKRVQIIRRIRPIKGGAPKEQLDPMRIHIGRHCPPSHTQDVRIAQIRVNAKSAHLDHFALKGGQCAQFVVLRGIAERNLFAGQRQHPKTTDQAVIRSGMDQDVGAVLVERVRVKPGLKRKAPRAQRLCRCNIQRASRLAHVVAALFQCDHARFLA